MAGERVSVRLAAVGGRQVCAELEGVGEAGSRGFGRLSRSMEAANAGLAAFSRRVRVASAAAVAAAAAAGVAMIRSGLQTVDAQAKLAQSLGTTVASIQTLERAGELAGVSMSGIEQATKDLTRRLSHAAAGFGPAAERAAVAGQLFGEEGSIAMSRIDTATLRHATEDVLAFGVVVSERDADQIERTNDAITRHGLIWRGLSNQLAVAVEPALEAVANAMPAVASRTGPHGIAIRSLFDNIGRLTTYAVTFATFIAGRWVTGLAAAALSVRGLATALVVLRGALNGVVTRINAFIETLNAALALLPAWATGEGGVRIGTLDAVDLSRIDNPFEGPAAGTAAAGALSAALARTYIAPPDLGLGAMAEDARTRADAYREAAGMLTDAATRPLAAWQALKDAVAASGPEAEAALADAAISAEALATRLDDTAAAAGGAGARSETPVRPLPKARKRL
jgi:hypothetical protein